MGNKKKSRGVKSGDRLGRNPALNNQPLKNSK
jgi:hypothetical protein